MYVEGSEVQRRVPEGGIWWARIILCEFIAENYNIFWRERSCTLAPPHFFSQLIKHDVVTRIDLSIFWWDTVDRSVSANLRLF